MIHRQPQPIDRPTTQAYRGYLVCVHPITDLVWIERDGFNVMHCTTRATLAENVSDAKRCVDQLLD